VACEVESGRMRHNNVTIGLTVFYGDFKNSTGYSVALTLLAGLTLDKIMITQIYENIFLNHIKPDKSLKSLSRVRKK
jgi:hypothetical protein